MHWRHQTGGKSDGVSSHFARGRRCHISPRNDQVFGNGGQNCAYGDHGSGGERRKETRTAVYRVDGLRGGYKRTERSAYGWPHTRVAAIYPDVRPNGVRHHELVDQKDPIRDGVCTDGKEHTQRQATYPLADFVYLLKINVQS